MPRRFTSTLRRALTRRGVIAAVSLGAIVLLARTTQAAPRVPVVGQPADSSILPGALWQRSEFFDGHTGTCGETALAMAESWGLQRYVSPATIYNRMADAGLMVNANGDSTNDELGQEAINDGFQIDVLAYNPDNYPLDNDTWRSFVNAHIGRQAIVLQLHNGQALVNELTGLGENAYHLQNHVITLVGFHQDGYSPLAGENLPSGWWAADGDALGEDHHLQFFADATLAAAQPFAAIALYARVPMPHDSTLPTQPPPAPPPAQPPAAASTPSTPTAPSKPATPGNTTQPPAATATPAGAPAAFTPPASSTAATPESPFTAGLTGYDISWPQCGTANPSPDSLAVIGVTGGMADVESSDPTRHAADHNPCLQEQWQWAEADSLAPMAYVNTANPPVNQTAEQAYAYGYTSASNAYKYATQEGVMSAMWWLDVETGNSWSTDTASNYASLRGTYDFLTQQGLTVGVYSTAYQWRLIAGANTLPGAPLWLAGASSASDATAACADTSQRFAGGVPWLVQFPRAPYDGDITCGPIH